MVSFCTYFIVRKKGQDSRSRFGRSTELLRTICRKNKLLYSCCVPEELFSTEVMNLNFLTLLTSLWHRLHGLAEDNVLYLLSLADSPTEPRTTEPRKTEPRKTQLRMD